MNKNQKLNLVLYILLGCYSVLVTTNIFLKFISVSLMFSVGCFVLGLYLFLKFIAYNSDSSLYLSSSLFFIGFVIYFSAISDFNIFQTLTLIYLCFVLGLFVLFIQYKSSNCLLLFISGLLLFFPIIFFAFNIINLLYFFIFLICCAIINSVVFFLFIH